MKRPMTKNTLRTRAAGAVAAIVMASSVLAACQNPTEASESAHDRKVKFDAWADSPSREKHRANGDLRQVSEADRNAIKATYGEDYFMNHEVQDAINELSMLPNPVHQAYYFTKVLPDKAKQNTKAQYLTSINKRNQQIVKNSRTRMA
ncbi:hypothetical protein ACYULU_09920 [Breznakiellaceae bacterium SP9]